MKQIIVFIAICGLPLTCKSQDQVDFSNYENELNLGYFNAFELNGLNEFGMGYKRMLNTGAVRTGIGLNFSRNTNDNETGKYKSSDFEISPKLGYEFYQYYNRLRLNYGADLVSSIVRSKSQYTSNDIPDSNRDDITRGYQLGARPVLGLTVFINSSISISTETYLDFRYYKSKAEHIRSTGTTTNTESGLSMNLGPLGIVSVNYHF